MSRIAKRPIKIPDSVTATQDQGSVKIKGPKGELARPFRSDIAITIANGEISLEPRRLSLESRALWGTYAAHLKNMIKGVTEGFEKKLIIEGVGYRAALAGDTLTMTLGYSHPIILKVPKGLTLKVEKNILTINGSDRELLGQFTATIRDWKRPDPYKEKGIRYDGEVVRRKQGKKVAA